MFNVVIGEFRHETNTFSHDLTDLTDFRRRTYVVGEDIRSFYAGVRSEVGGFLEVLEARDDVRLIPVVAAMAMPSGPVTAEMFDQIRDMLVDGIRAAQRVDAVLLALHGAMVTETSEDGEGDLLEAVRREVGPDVPIIVTLDLHSNFTYKMERNADAFFHYHSYPHVDMYERGLQAAQVLMDTLEGKAKPAMKCARRPLLLPSMPTAYATMQPHVQKMLSYEQNPKVLGVSISHGFFCADIEEAGLTVVAVTDNDPELAQQIADELAEAIWQDRALLRRRLYTADEAIAEAVASEAGPIILADVADNPGGGSPCDGTHLLRAMLEHGVTNAAVALIYDPESVDAAEAAGVGNTVRLRLGGKALPDLMGAPIECEAYVRLISDGRYVNKGPMGAGLPVDLIKTAVVVVNGIEIIVSKNITQPYDVQIFRAHGIEPTDKKIIMLKSTVHFRAHFEPLAKKVLDVECPGLLPQNPATLPYKRVKRPIYPLDEI